MSFITSAMRPPRRNSAPDERPTSQPAIRNNSMNVLFIRQSDCNNEPRTRQSIWSMSATSSYSQLSGSSRGALWMIASAIAFTLMMTLVRYLGADYGPALQTFYRQLAGTIVLLPLMLRDPRRAFATSRPGILLL